MVEFVKSKLYSWLEYSKNQRKLYFDVLQHNKGHNVGYTNFSILWIIHELKGVSLNYLNNLKIIDRRHLLLSIEFLLDKGFILKKRDDTITIGDRRKSPYILYLSDLGTKTFEDLIERYEKEIENANHLQRNGS